MTAVCLFVSKDIAKLISILLLYDSILKLPKLGRADAKACDAATTDGPVGNYCADIICRFHCLETLLYTSVAAVLAS